MEDTSEERARTGRSVTDDPALAGGRGGRSIVAAARGRLGAIGREPVSPRRLARWMLVALLVVLPSLAWGVSTATAQGNLGPHSARYDVTLDGEITIDLGPLGTVVIDSPLPLWLGARVVVQEIPREITIVDGSTTLAALGADLEEYVQFFTGPEATIEVAARALVWDAVRRSAAAVVVLTAAIVLVRWALGGPRRAELAQAAAVHRPALAGGVALTLVVVATLTGSVPRGDDLRRERTASPVFDGTPLEGARITGRLAGVIDTYGGYVVDAYRENEAFYASATASVRAAWERRMEQEERTEARRAELRARIEASVPDDEGPVVEQAATTDEVEPVSLVVVSDLHCNVGMAPVIREVAELSGAQVILNAGDTTVNGTAVESYCITAFAGAVPPGATMVVADGNHDSPETSAQERAAGMVVLDGSVVDVAGVRILGDADPRATRIGVGTTLTGNETLPEQSERLADVACEAADGVDLLLVHDPGAGNAALERGCVTAQISGHYHRRDGPTWYGHGTRYISSSTAGALLGRPTVGPLSGTAEITVLRFDPEARRILDYRLVKVSPSAEATVSAARGWPGERPEPRPFTPYR